MSTLTPNLGLPRFTLADARSLANIDALIDAIDTNAMPVAGTVRFTSATPTTIALTLTGAVAQTADLLHVNNSGATTLAAITKDGAVQSLANGTAGGFLAGTAKDVQWYRDSGPQWRTPQTVQVDGLLGVGILPSAKLHASIAGTGTVFEVDVNGVAPWFHINDFGIGAVGNGTTKIPYIAVESDTLETYSIKLRVSPSTGQAILESFTGNAASVLLQVASMDDLWLRAGSAAGGGDATKAARVLATAGTRFQDWFGTTTYGTIDSTGLTIPTGRRVLAATDGSGGGHYGGALADVQWYRDTGPQWRTPQQVRVDGNLGVGVTPTATFHVSHPGASGTVFQVDYSGDAPYYHLNEFGLGGVGDGATHIPYFAVQSDATIVLGLRMRVTPTAASPQQAILEAYTGTTGTPQLQLTAVDDIWIRPGTSSTNTDLTKQLRLLATGGVLFQKWAGTPTAMSVIPDTGVTITATIATTVPLTITGNASQSGNLLLVQLTGSVPCLTVGPNGAVLLGIGAPATTATAGFVYVPVMAGAPTGVPASKPGYVALAYDNVNHKWVVYDAAWRGVALV